MYISYFFNRCSLNSWASFLYWLYFVSIWSYLWDQSWAHTSIAKSFAWILPCFANLTLSFEMNRDARTVPFSSSPSRFMLDKIFDCALGNSTISYFVIRIITFSNPRRWIVNFLGEQLHFPDSCSFFEWLNIFTLFFWVIIWELLI
jgi:hypothetical protein